MGVSVSKTKTPGFTIVELLIVIVIIAVLAAITVVAFNGIQDRAKGSSLAQEFKSIEKGLQMLAAEEGWSTWPNEGSFASANVTSMITNTNLKNYLQRVNPPSGYYLYDNDGDASGAVSGCASMTGGVNIGLVTSDAQKLTQLMDDAIDDGDPNCGKVRYYSTSNWVIYKISGTQSL